MRLSYGATPDELAVQKTRGKMGPSQAELFRGRRTLARRPPLWLILV